MSQQQKSKQQDPQEAAINLGLGFKYHDEQKRELATEAFAVTDTFQFQHVSEDTARDASVAYVDALWEKDRIEAACSVDGEFDIPALKDADWSPVRRAFERRARHVGMDPKYAEFSTKWWRRHKVGGNYWTPLKKAQVRELRAALQDPEYPRKPRDGQSGYGPEVARYEVGVELHDTRRFEEMIDAITPYFERIARRRQSPNHDTWTSSKSVSR